MSESENPVIPSPTPKRTRPRTNKDWWPNQLDLSVLHQHSPLSNPMGEDFNYAEEFKTLDLEALKRDLIEVMTTSQDWWPADYGHYGPLFIRMTWHAAGTYRIADGRGGGGRARSASRPSTAGPTTRTSTRRAGCSGRSSRSTAGRSPGPICWSSPATSPWSRWGSRRSASASGDPTSGSPRRSSGAPRTPGLETSATAATGEIQGPFGADHMGLIYVNPEGPGGNPDPRLAAKYIRETFRRMAMNDEETVGAHRRRPHVRQDPWRCRRGPARRSRTRGRRLEEQGLGWKNSFGSGKGADTITSGLEGAWTNEPTKWDNGFLENLYKYDWELTTSPAGAKQWTPNESRGPGHRAGCARSVEAARPDDADDGPRAEDGSDLRGRSRSASSSIRTSSPTPSPGRGTSCCTATWARSRATSARGFRSRSSGRTPSPRSITADRRAGHRRPQGQDPRLGTVHLPAGLHRLGVGGELPRHRQAWRGQRGAHPPRAAEGLGGQRTRPSWPRCCRPSSRSSRSSTAPSPAARRSRSPT